MSFPITNGPRPPDGPYAVQRAAIRELREQCVCALEAAQAVGSDVIPNKVKYALHDYIDELVLISTTHDVDLTTLYLQSLINGATEAMNACKKKPAEGDQKGLIDNATDVVNTRVIPVPTLPALPSPRQPWDSIEGAA